jgi:hypothetical protein
MDEHIIFLTSQEQHLTLLHDLARTTARRLLLVFPEDLDRSRASLLLRLIRQQAGELALSLRVISADRQTRLLAEQIGFTTAATLDEARGLAPGRAPTSRPHAGPSSTPSPFPPLQPLEHSQPAPDPLAPANPPGQPVPSEHRPLPAQKLPTAISGRSSQYLERLLRDGYLPNPSAIPSLEEEAQKPSAKKRASVPG